MSTFSGPRLPRFEQFSAIRRYQPTLAVSPSGDTVAYSTNTSGQFNLWVQAANGGPPRQLTLYTERTVRQIVWSPDGRSLAFHADANGDEFHQIFMLGAHGGWPDQLTDTPDAQHYIGEWSPDSSRFAYSSNDRQRNEIDVVVRDMAAGETQRLSAGGIFLFAGWAPDSRRLLALQALGNTDSNIYLCEPGAEPRLLTPHEGEAQHMPVGWAADGSGFYFISNQDREFKALAFYDLSGGSWRWVETPEWDIESAAISHNGRALAWVVNEQGYSSLYVRDLTSDTLLELPPLPRGVISNLAMSHSGRTIAFLHASAVQPTEVFAIDLDARLARRLTDSFLGGLTAEELVEPELVSFASFDGRQIPAFLFRPRHTHGTAPVVLSIHGGPEAQERPVYLYSGLYQYLLSRGIGVLAPNIRGSTGYGQSYQKLIHRDWGGDELKDIEAAAHYLRSLDWVDPMRIGVFGASFGGFATLSAVSRLPEIWATGVDIVGPSNLITFVQSVPPFWKHFTDSWIGNPERDRELLIERSPISYVDQIKAPMFIIQGAKDPRVVKGESDQMVERLRELGRTVRYDVYENEGHGFTRRENELKAIKDTAEWLEQHLQRRRA